MEKCQNVYVYFFHLFDSEISAHIYPKNTLVARIKEGGTLNVTCKGQGSPTPHVQWDVSKLRSNYSTISRNNGVEEDLFIHSASAFDNGWLACVVSNAAVKNRSTIGFTVKCK